MAKKTSGSDYRTVMQNIKKGDFSPVYLLMGDEDYYIDKVAEALEKSVVDEEERDFNSTIFYGADSDVKQVIARAQQYPVMAERQLVMLKEAQTLSNSKSQLNLLASYVNHPNPTTVLVVTYKGESLGATHDFLKSMGKASFVVLRSDRLRDYELAGPVADYCRERKVAIDDKTIALLCDYIGNPLSKLFGEIEKLIVSAGSSMRITPELVEAVVGISKEYNTFELLDAISLRDYPKAMRIMTHFTKNPKQNPPEVVIAMLFNYFSRLFCASILKDKSDASLMAELDLKSSYGLRNYKNGLRNYNARSIDGIIHALRQTDGWSKGIGSAQNRDELMIDLLYKIFTL